MIKFTCKLCGEEFSEEKECKTHQKKEKSQLQKPFIKWVGGKTQIIEYVFQYFPKEMNNYHEIFVGGGSILLALLSLQKQGTKKIKGTVYAYDNNEALINLYKNIQDHHEELFEYIQSFVTDYENIKVQKGERNPSTIEEAKTSKESYYYWMRKKYNSMDKTTVECSALFMVINKTCFRGVYREGPNGYNVPFGHYKTTPNVISKEELSAISELIKNVQFLHSDFRKSMKNIKKGDFVYLDPPYAPENKTSFVKYTSDGFDLETHKTLFDEINKLDKRKIKFVMSNANVSLVTDNFKNCNYGVIEARRAINSKKPQSTTEEIIIFN